MRLKIANLVEKCHQAIRLIYLFFIFFTLHFALNSVNLRLGFTTGDRFLGMGTTWVAVIFLIIVFLIGFELSVNRTFFALCHNVFIKRGRLTASIFLIVTLVWQLLLILNTHPDIGFDPGAIHAALLQPNTLNNRSYFSYNSNNLALLLIQHQISGALNQTSWLFFDLLNLVLVGITIVFNISTVYILDTKKVVIALYTHSIWIALFPMTLVPYTDIAVLPLVAALIMCYVAIVYTQLPFIIKLGISAVLGGLIPGIYFIKPSAIVPAIAICLIEILHFGIYAKNHSRVSKLLLTSICFLTIGVSYQWTTRVINQQTFIHITKGRTLPPIHFISMGVSGDGGYNPDDALAMAKQPSQQAMAKYSEDKLVERLRQKGFFGYLAFLLHKQDKNTSDGTFTWLKEGHFMTATPVKTGGIKSLMQNIFYPGGHYLSDFHFIAQIFWVLCLGIITLGWRVRDRMTDVLRLSIVGGFCYLLIFEGGRSRYIIQFLPLFILLTIIVFPSVVSMLKEKLSWLKSD